MAGGVEGALMLHHSDVYVKSACLQPITVFFVPYDHGCQLVQLPLLLTTPTQLSSLSNPIGQMRPHSQ